MIDQVRPGHLSAWLQTVATHGDPVVLDVREPSEHRLASVKADGFELLTIPMGTIPLRLAELDPERPVACLCHHGGRSAQVCMFLERQGFSSVINLAGGVAGWAAQVDPRMAQY